MAARFHSTGGASALPLSLIAQAIPRLSRHELEDLTERLIDQLDAIDGDPDLEREQDHCDAADDGCGAAISHGAVRWGSEWDSKDGLVPEYGVDQTQGPVGRWHS
jgi:hypothetical protein